MKKILAAVLAAAMFTTSFPAFAGEWSTRTTIHTETWSTGSRTDRIYRKHQREKRRWSNRDYRQHRLHGEHRHHHNNNVGEAIGAGIIGFAIGAIVVGVLSHKDDQKEDGLYTVNGTMYNRIDGTMYECVPGHHDPRHDC